MSEKQIPHLPYMNTRQVTKSLDERYFETVLMGFAAVLLVPVACVLAVLAIPFWLVGLVVRHIEKIER